MTRPQNHRRPPVTLVALLIFGVSAIGVASPAQGQEPLSGAKDEGLIDLYSQPSELGPQEAIAPLSPAVRDASGLNGLPGPGSGARALEAPDESSAGVNVRVTNSGGTQSEISMAATGGGGQNVVITYNGGPNGLGFVSSQNGGGTFQAEQSLPVPAGSNPCCDPSVVANNGTNFFLIQLFRDDGANAPAAGNCTNSLHTSTNGGQTFSNIVSSPFSYAPGNDFPDQPHIGINRANPNELYVTTRHFTSGVNCPQTGGGGNVQGEVVCSNDGGATWSNPFVYPAFTDTAHIDVAPDGRAFIVGNGIGTNMNTTRVVLWRSNATTCPGAGNTPNFTGPTVVDDNLTFGQVVDREFPQPTVLADPTMNDRVYVNYSADDTQGSGDREAFLSRCDFAGAVGTCTAPLTVNDNPADGTDQYFPMACIDPGSNNVLVSWNDARSGQHEIRETTVTNNGTTTGTSRAVSEVQWPIVNFGGAPDYGDYNENNGACRANHHYAAWTSQVSPPGTTPASTDPDVFFAVVNQPPVADAGGPYTTSEGTDVPLSGSATDPENDTPFTFAWDFDNDGQFDDATGQSPSFDRVGQDGSNTVCVRVTDSVGDSGEDCTTVTVTNVAPAFTAVGTDSPVDENSPVSLSAAGSDAGWLDDLTITVDWGFGSPIENVSGTEENVRPDATLQVLAPHTYGDDSGLGTFPVQVCLSDDDTTVCQAPEVDVDNLAPTATIDASGAVDVNGVATILAHAGEDVTFNGNSTDEGSDDLTLTWDWGDGPPSPDELTISLVNPPFTDPDPSPDIDPRDVDDQKIHAFGQACTYDVVFSALDDDFGSATETIKVLITGNEANGRSTGYWAGQYRQRGGVDFDDATLSCYLEIAAFVSKVFNEERDASTFERAQAILFDQGGPVSKRDQLDRDLLTAWLNFANGAVEWNEQVDTGNGPPDTPFHQAMQTAESVRLDPNATPAQIDAQRAIVQRINNKI
jgi:hypothetical protein